MSVWINNGKRMNDLHALKHRCYRLIGANITLFILTLWGWLV